MPSNKKTKAINEQGKVLHSARRSKKKNGNVGKQRPTSDGMVQLRNISRSTSNWDNFLKMKSSTTSAIRHEPQKLKIGLPNVKKVTETKEPVQVTRVIGIDCEMVGVAKNGSQSVLARVSLVNALGECIYDKYVKPLAPVTDYRTFVSGIRPHDLEDGEDFFVVQRQVARLVKDKILVGHGLKNDLHALLLNHPPKHLRDTALFWKFRNKGKLTSLKALALKLLNVTLQKGEHDSVQDARVAMQLYQMYRKDWEDKRRV